VARIVLHEVVDVLLDPHRLRVLSMWGGE
jgi:hypothetical protein